MFGEIPATSTTRLFDYNGNKFRAIHVNNPLAFQTTKDACLTVDAGCYTKTEIDSSFALKQINVLLGEIPTTNTSRLLDYKDNKFRAIHVNNPLPIQTTHDAYLTIDAHCYTRS